jgi:hypothetical protein
LLEKSAIAVVASNSIFMIVSAVVVVFVGNFFLLLPALVFRGRSYNPYKKKLTMQEFGAHIDMVASMLLW